MLLARSEWKRVEDGLPVRSGLYWVTRPDGILTKAAFFCGAFDCSVVAWMSENKPKPYTAPQSDGADAGEKE